MYYSKSNCVLGYDENDDCLVIGTADCEDLEVVEVPVEFIENKETRKAIFDVYINMRDTDPTTIYRAIREAASDKTIYWASELVGGEFWS